MADVMTFPETVEEFMEQYKITDTEKIYTNGTELVPIFRMKQWFEHLPSAQPERIIYANMSDEEFEKWLYEHGICNPDIHDSIPCSAVPLLIDSAISDLPSAEPEQKRGRWLKAYGEHEAMGMRPFYRYCSSCNEAMVFPYKYCPNCGADMRGDSE